MDQHQERPRGHFHRSRRGPERRSPERRTPPQAQQGGRDQVDVEQIMRDIRARIAQRHGIELSNQQIQELAARRLESILDPRTVKPALLDQLRRSAGEPPAAKAALVEPPYTFEDSTLYESHRGLLRFIRRLLNPLLKLFFNPNPLVRALNTQARLNLEAAERDTERERRHTEWNALQYEIVQRLVTEVSRVSLELQAQSMRIESLAAKVDFNERRVRGIEGTMHHARPAVRATESAPAAAAAPAATAEPATGSEAPAEGPHGESARRRRRRRRGRRSGAVPGEAGLAGPPLLSETAEADTAEGESVESETVEGEVEGETVGETVEAEPLDADAAEAGSVGADTAGGAVADGETAERVMAEAEAEAAEHLRDEVAAEESVAATVTTEGDALAFPEPRETMPGEVEAPTPAASATAQDATAAPSAPSDTWPDSGPRER
jgi:hypothetical protein